MTKLDQARNEINRIDREMARLFCARMDAAREVAAYKKETGMPIFDPTREAQVLESNAALLDRDELCPLYRDFLQSTMDLSKRYQRQLLESDADEDGAVRLHMSLGADSYDIHIKRGLLSHAAQYLDLDRRVCIVTDSGVPTAYAAAVAAQCRESITVTFPAGEASKNLDTYAEVLARMLDAGFTRRDCVVAVGGGVVGDLAGFAAASYMRGIDFYNCPTTLLSQIDSSIGGKVAVDFHGYKNIVGAFHQPRCVLIDPDVLATLPPRRIADGLAEAIKMAATSDPVLFELLEMASAMDHVETVIARSLRIKRDVVEQDEKETGLRRVLNFGHTLGHAIESCEEGRLFHGECVALGMLCMCAPEVRDRIRAVLERVGLPTVYDGDVESIGHALRHDKKAAGEGVHAVTVSAIGQFTIEHISYAALAARLGNIGSEK